MLQRKNIRWRTSIILMMLALSFICFTGKTAMGEQKVLEFSGTHVPVWNLEARSPFLIGGYGDNFSYDGSRVLPLIGKARVIVDTQRDAGSVVVDLKGTINPEKDKKYTGDISIYYEIERGGPAFYEGGVADFIYLHGNTGQEGPAMPKVRTYLAAWGRADVYVNSQLVYKGLHGHFMYTEGVRSVGSKAIYNKDMSGFFSPKAPENYSIAHPDGTELHFVAHSMETDGGNFPPQSVWIHINFENVTDLSQSSATRICAMHDGKCGPGCKCGCMEGKPCAMHDGKCGAGCGCGCNIKVSNPRE